MLPPRSVILQPRDGRPGKDGKDADPAEIERAVREAVAALPVVRAPTLPWVARLVRDEFDLTQQVLAGPVDGPPQIVMDVTRDEHDRIELVHISAAE